MAASEEQDRAELIDKMLEQLNYIHAAPVSEDILPDESVRADDIMIEAHSKLITRCNEISGFLSAFGHIHSVNGVVLPEHDSVNELAKSVISKLSAKILKAHRDMGIPYAFIHGDFQMSNTMVDTSNENGDVWVIDPRGYFGTTSLYGPIAYDRAKMLYALSGYDLFNYSEGFYISQLRDGELKFALPSYDSEVVQTAIDTRFSELEHMWLAVIWIGLAQYIKCDPVKCLCAFYHGMTLALKHI